MENLPRISELSFGEFRQVLIEIYIFLLPRLPALKVAPVWACCQWRAGDCHAASLKGKVVGWVR